MALTQLFFTISCLVFPLGQLANFSLFGTNIHLFDVFISLFFLSIVISKKYKPNKFLLLFLLLNILSLFFASSQYGIQLTPLFYFCRLVIILSLLVTTREQIISPRLSTIHTLIILGAIIAFGFIQYFFYPDLTSFIYLGWDPHLNRLVGSFIDPTFTGILLTFLLLWLFFSDFYQLWWGKLLLVLAYISLALTYSRSSFLALVLASLYYSIKTKRFFPFLITLLTVVTTLFVLPKPPGEGTKLERTSTIQAKIDNYKKGISLFTTAPLTGIGYNNIGVSQNNPTSHSNWGFDGSLLNILVTTGILGTLIFCLLLASYFRSINLPEQIIFFSLFIHCFFSNSLFYPWTIFLLFLFRQTKYRKLS